MSIIDKIDKIDKFNETGNGCQRNFKRLPVRANRSAVAEYLGTNTGTIAAGHEADLILLDANPLVDITNSDNIHGVMLRGTWLSKNDLLERLPTYRQED